MTEEDRVKWLIDDRSGEKSDRAADLERKIMMLIEKKQHQIRRIRVAVAVAWGTVAALLVGGGVMESVPELQRRILDAVVPGISGMDIAGHDVVTSSLAVLAGPMLTIALFLTVSWYVRSVSLRFDTVQQALAAIQERLGQIPCNENPQAR